MKNITGNGLTQKRKVNHWVHGFLFVFWMVALFFSLSVNVGAQSKNSIQLLRAYEQADGLYLDVQMSLTLPPEVIDALQKGIVLYFVMHADVKRERWYWFDATDAQTTKSIKLSYQPLLQQYRVSVGGIGQSLATLPEALNVIGTVSQWHIMDSRTLAISGRKRLNFTFELDHSKLPSPFQFSVNNNDEWLIQLTQSVDLQLTSSKGGQ